MECHEIQKKLEAFLDGELPPEESDIVNAHLEFCADCQREFEKISAVDRMVAETEGLDPGTEAWERMRQGIRQGIMKEKAARRVGIFDWANWLLSPQYAVVKVGAVLAVVALAFVVSRELTIEQVTPIPETVPEFAVPGAAGEKSGKAAPADVESVEERLTPDKAEDLIDLSQQKGQQPTSKIAAEQTQETDAEELPIVQDSRWDVQDVREIPQPSVPSDKEGATPPRGEEPPTILPMMKQEASELRLEQEVLDKEAAAPKKATEQDVGDVLQTLPGVHTDEKGEYHFGGGRSQEILPLADEEKEELLEAEPKRMLTTQAEGIGTQPVGMPSRGKAANEMEMVVTSGLGRDAILNEPFSEISYWETYGVVLESGLNLSDEIDSLWYEYRRCEDQSCQDDVAPFLVDALFRHVVETGDGHDIQETKQHMIMRRDQLRDTWGVQRYDMRWQRLLELEQ